MNFLKSEREHLERFLPGLDAELAEQPLQELEKRGNPCLGMLIAARGAGLLIPTEYGGLGATPVEAVRVHRAVATRSPSLSIAMTMHNFSVATLVEYTFYGDYTVDLLKSVAENQLLVASGFAEGRTGSSILDPLMRAEPVDGGYRINGAKKPCTLTYSMGLLTASVAVPSDNGGAPRRAVAVVPADAEGIDRQPFWTSSVLGGAESDQLVLKDVFIPQDQLFFPEVDEGLDAVEAGGFLWFELLVSASYLGVASALAERALAGGKGTDGERVQLAIELESAMSGLEGVAQTMMTGERGEDILVRSLLVRFAVQGAIERSVMRAAELLGGMSFIASPDVAYLLSASRALAFHPPSRLSVAPAIDGFLAGGPMEIA
ncbi:MAG: acyl-CoA dehydrogenase family protein [Acidobacteriota bacterium]